MLGSGRAGRKGSAAGDEAAAGAEEILGAGVAGDGTGAEWETAGRRRPSGGARRRLRPGEMLKGITPHRGRDGPPCMWQLLVIIVNSRGRNNRFQRV